MNDLPKISAQQSLANLGLENFAPYLMNRIMGRYNAALRDEMAALGLTTPQMRALAVLSVNDGILISELAVYAVVEVSTLSRALDGLAQGGLVRRETDRDDNRATRLFLTGDGHAANDRMWPHMAVSYERMFRGIPQSEKTAFVATLNTVLGNVRVHDF